ncbi:MAG: glycosyltransferase [Anaerolineales bacterium]
MQLPWIDYLAIKRSGLFDEYYYLKTYPDCRRSDIDPISHFIKYGYKEGRNPSASFDTNFYLQTNPDVSTAKINPLIHYLRFGQKEGRLILPQGLSAQSPTTQGVEFAQPASVYLPTEDINVQEQVSAELVEPQLTESSTDTGKHFYQSKELICGIDSQIPKSIIVGKGTYLLVKGWCFSPQHQIKNIYLKYADKKYPIYNRSIYREDVLATYITIYSNPKPILHCGFWGLILFEKIEVEEHYTLELSVTLTNGREISSPIGDIILIPTSNKEITKSLSLDPAQPRLAICMATYNPSMELFKIQIQSIIDQSFTNWICIVNDDHSRVDVYDQMCALLSRDPRFFIFRNDDRLGHYRNFESALQKVPHEVDFIAFSDQDDEWYPDKLARCLLEFKSDEDKLVYCDLDVLSSNGEKISDTYWFNRENNYTSLQTLLYANTVTGAASVFRAGMLDDILPFPLKIGDQYHDHWVACVALSSGNIKYINSPLYAYKQHAENVYGIQSKVEPYTLVPEIHQYVKQYKNISVLKHEVRMTIDNLESSYNFYLLRLIVLTKTLLLRVGSISKGKKKVLLQVSSSERKMSGLLSHSISYLIHKGPSLGYELFALRSYLGHRFRNWIFNIYSQTRINQIRAKTSTQLAHSTITPVTDVQKNVIEHGNEDGMVRLLKQMIAPLLLEVSTDEPKRINFVMATVDFNYIFGGYLAMFNLAKKIGQFDHKIRIVIVEPCDYKPNEWRKKIQAYPGLEDLFDFVETSYHYDRNFPLNVNPEDIFIATSCWTAHIASRTAKQLNGRKIIFFAQEYEPIFFPMGSMHALSHQSYFLPQYTIFSTELLRQFFRNHKIGVYKNSLAEGDAISIVINNAIHPFEISFKDISERKKKKFLFYARPEAHAARNLYELGLLSLENAIQQGVFSEEWDYYGIGTIGNNRLLPLGNNHKLTLLPKVSLKEYLELIPTFDLGMSLMLSPHPSLVPLEMAAAGMPAITNTYENKTVSELSEISTNLIGVEPTIDGITQGLREGVNRVYNYLDRINGARINWPTDWNQVFDENFKKKLNQMMRNC